MACRHGVYPEIDCDICWPSQFAEIDKKIIHGWLPNGGGAYYYDENGNINCEVDGETIAGVHLLVFDIGEDDRQSISIITDSTVAADMIGEQGIEPIGDQS